MPHPRERIEALRKGRLASDDGRVTLAMAILGPDWGAWEVVEHDIRMAREFGLVSSSHTRRRRSAWCPTAMRAWPRRACSAPTTTWCTARATTPPTCGSWSIPARRLTSTVLVELHHHIGDTMVAAFREQGGEPSLGIDVELYTTGQMFREMQAALLFVRGKEVRNNAMRGNSPLKTIPVRSREALEWATINGAPRLRARRQDRHAHARQEGRHRHAARRRREHGAGLGPDLFDRRDRRRRQCRHCHHRRRWSVRKTAS